MTVREHASASRKPPMLAMAAAIALALSACGGGPAATTGTPNPPGGRVSSPPPTPAYSNVATAAATAAAVTPSHLRQLSFLRSTFISDARQYLDYFVVYQPSKAILTSSAGIGLALPPAVLVVAPDSTGPISYTIGLHGGATIEFEGVQPYSLDVNFSSTDTTDDIWYPSSATHGTAKYTKNDKSTVSLNKARLAASSKVGGLVAQAIVYTDFDVTANDKDESKPTDDPGTPIDETIDPAGDDLDYIAAGVWIAGPLSEDGPDALTSAGAFAMGKVPYTGLAATGYDTLTSVKYNGVAGGKRFSGGSIRNFETTVSLTANFSGTGSITGTVKNVGGGQSLTLTSGSMTEGTHGGPYSGTTQLVGTDGNDVDNFAGTWGGAFFGAQSTLSTANGPPGTAGTFGASISADDNNGNSDSILGVFIAHRDDTSSN